MLFASQVLIVADDISAILISQNSDLVPMFLTLKVLAMVEALNHTIWYLVSKEEYYARLDKRIEGMPVSRELLDAIFELCVGKELSGGEAEDIEMTDWFALRLSISVARRAEDFDARLDAMTKIAVWLEMSMYTCFKAGLFEKSCCRNVRGFIRVSWVIF